MHRGKLKGFPLCVFKELYLEQLVLKNGLKIVLENMPYLRSVSVGVWIRAGSMLETVSTNGLAHFAEHMAFEGTVHRNAKQLAEEMDLLGGNVNASTGKLSTNYYIRVLDEHLPLAMDILADIVIHSRYEKDIFEKEKGVILEEISMVEDSPEEVAFDLLSEAVYGEQSLGMTVAGKPERIRAYTLGDLEGFKKRFYGPENAVLVMTGHFDRKQALDLLERHFGAWTGAGRAFYPHTVAVPEEKCLFKEKDTEQIHLCLGYQGISVDSPDIYRMSVMNSILGGASSSRLFQRIREELGLAYAVDTCPYSYPGCGEFTVYAATAPKNAGKVLEQIDLEIQKLMRDGITGRELLHAKEQLKSSYALGLEGAFSRMQSMGSQMILMDKIVTLEEQIAGIERVNVDDVMRSVEDLAHAKRSIAVTGKRPSRYLPGL